MMGEFSQINAYDSFLSSAQSAFAGSVSPWEIGKAIMLFIGLLFKDWGTAMVLGCLPWALIGGIISYIWTYKWLVRYHAKRANAAERRRYWRQKLQAEIKARYEKHRIKKEARKQQKRSKKYGKKPIV